MASSDFVSFMNGACTAFHAVREVCRRLEESGFVMVDECEAKWELKAGGKYFYRRNGSAIVAFAVGGLYDAATSGAILVGAHTDSPCPKLKPRSFLEKGGKAMLGVVGYGGGIWHTWFDRDLTVAGRALVKENDRVVPKLVRVEKPVCRVSTLAIHLSVGDERSTFKPNLQNHLPPMLTAGLQNQLSPPSKKDEKQGLEARHHSVLVNLVSTSLAVKAEDLVDLELQLCDTQPSCIGGALDEFIFSGRLDNLCSCYASISALCSADFSNKKCIGIVALFDHEEVGSLSATGAQGPLLKDALLRIPASLDPTYPDVAASAFRARSLLISADMAHAQHPNYPERHDSEHAPQLGKGLVIKHNANQRYATNDAGATFIRSCAKKADLKPCQEFAVKADCACGSTIGPISGANLGIRTVDVGAPQLSMHSIRECMHVDDLDHSISLFKAAFDNFDQLQPDLLLCN